jgi:hypothetical protein
MVTCGASFHVITRGSQVSQIDTCAIYLKSYEYRLYNYIVKCDYMKPDCRSMNTFSPSATLIIAACISYNAVWSLEQYTASVFHTALMFLCYFVAGETECVFVSLTKTHFKFLFFGD